MATNKHTRESSLIKGYNTKCVHSGTILEPSMGGITSPIYTSTSTIYPNETSEVYYPRYFTNPNQKAVAEKIASLEYTDAALVFASGMAAITGVIFAFLKRGDHAIFSQDIYGGTYKFVKTKLHDHEISYTIIASSDISEYEKAITPNTKLIYFETPSNPLLSIVDIKSIAELGKKHKILTVIDNTFASPINQNPSKLGVDIILHSGTKYLNGHSDLCCGVVAGSHENMKKLVDTAYLLGGAPSAQDCFMLERGLKTLGIRVKQQNANAMAIAKYLEGHEKVKKVYYPGLESHKNHNIAKQQMHGGFGGMLAFEPKCDLATARKLVKAFQVITGAVSLGGVETIVCFPSETSHAGFSLEDKKYLGISEEVMRMSVGIEDTEDLIQDLESAFKQI